MKSVLLSLFLFGIIIIGTFSPIFAYIPPTVAYDNITASNGSAMAQTYDSHINFQGLRGMQVFASNNSQTIYFNATLSNGTKITPITCSTNYQLHSINSLGIFTCALNNNTGGPALDTMQNLTPAQAYVYAKNSTDFNFQFRGMNFTGSLTGSNSSNLITIHGNIYQNNTGANLGTHGIGIYSSMSSAVLQFLKLLGGQGISVTSNSTNGIISTNFKVNNQTCAAGYFVSAYDNKTGNYVCTNDSDPFLTSAILSINGNTNAAQTINSSSPIVTTNSGAVHTLSCPTCNTRTNQGTYNTTQANNVNINTNGYQINFINGTGSTVNVVNSHSGHQVNVTIASTGSGGTITGSGATQQMTYWTGTSSIGGATNMIWNNANNVLRGLSDVTTSLGTSSFKFLNIFASVINGTNMYTNIIQPSTTSNINVTTSTGHIYLSDYGCGSPYLGIGGNPTLTGCTNYGLLLAPNSDTLINRASGHAIMFREANANQMMIASGGNVQLVKILSVYNNVNTAGLGVPAIYGYNRLTGLTGASGTVTSYTVGGTDGTFEVSYDLYATRSTTYSFYVDVTWTDEASNSQTLHLPNMNPQIAGVLQIVSNPDGPTFQGLPVTIHVKHGTTITIQTNAGGTYTTVTYNIEGFIKELS